ncbi:MAG TPA: hypothetical protein PLR25_29685 [Planctomycetaceae bacterium]|nr:hypothetical protein [Planctomycetaceae bacterium]
MPLFDHFRPPIFNKGSWEGFHGGWPMTMVMDLCKSLPEQYAVEPRVHLGKNFEVDVCTFDVEGEMGFGSSSFGAGSATEIWAPPEPTLTLELDPTEIYEYEVLDVFCQTDPAFAPDPPATYAVTCRSHSLTMHSRFESWAYPMVVGQRLPVLPIWLDNDHAISLNLEVSYQQTCSVLRLI